MIEAEQKIQFNYFADLTKIQPTPKLIHRFMNLFSEFGFLPSNFQELTNAGPTPRMRLASPNNEWNVLFLSGQLIIDRNPTSYEGFNLQDISGYLVELNKILTIVNQFKLVPAKRISLITASLTADYTQEKLDTLYKKLIVPLPFYKNKPLTEWLVKSVTCEELELNKRNEQLNVITEISLVRGQLQLHNELREFQKLNLGFDINTHQDEDEPRFNAESAISFAVEAFSKRGKLLDEIAGVING